EDVENISYNQTFKGNPDITWEKNRNFNAGFELNMFGNRLNLDVEYFQRKTNDLLYMRPLPLSSGFGEVPENIGDMENRGIEVTLDGLVVQTAEVSLNVFLNATHYKNEITKLPESDLPKNAVIDGSRILEEGGSMFPWYMREWAG